MFIMFYMLFYEYIAIKLIWSFDDDGDALFIVSFDDLPTNRRFRLPYQIKFPFARNQKPTKKKKKKT